MGMTRNENRASLRKEALQRRNDIPPQMRFELSKRIATQVTNWIKTRSIDSVMIYLGMRSEVDTHDVLDYLFNHGKVALAPVMEMKCRTLIPYRIENAKGDLERHRYGMLQPNKEICDKFPLDQIDLIVVPGIAFDLKGYRVGFGGGFYDRFLPNCPEAIWIGLAFEQQIVADIQPQPWDVPLHYIFTEKGNVVCRL